MEHKTYWTTTNIRKTWLDFFKKHNHLIIESQSLIPKNDPSLLWINSGVATLKPYFSGEQNPPAPNLTNSQRCIRTNDIENVGVTSRHQTFFEMLGNFSIGGYFKTEAITLAFDLLINYFHFDINKLYITVYENDNIAYDCWIKLGINKSHIIKCGKERNFWDVGAGPCGPCTEIYYDRGQKYDPQNKGETLFFNDLENDRYVEIWNIVFSEFNNINNEYVPLVRKNIDTGAGIERLSSILQDVPTNFDTDTFQIIINKIDEFTNNDFKYQIDAYFSQDEKQLTINKSHKIIADHLRAIVFAISDGAVISNKERGYILKRLLRRAIIELKKLEINQNIFDALVYATIKSMDDYYPYLNNHKQRVLKIINNEYEQFIKILNESDKLFAKFINNNNLDDHSIFKLVETYGIPLDLIQSYANTNNIKLNLDGFEKLFKNHQMISNAQQLNAAMHNQNGALINLKLDSKFNYDVDHINDAKIIALFDDDFNEVTTLNGDGYVVFDNTCFYATSGGQLHDIGTINNINVDNVIKGPNLQHIHHIKNHNKQTLSVNDNCNLKIDQKRRAKLAKNHSVEHLLHAALTKFIDPNIKQEGAFKSPEKVTFDFQLDYRPTNEQLNQIETHINNLINAQIAVNVLNIELDEAKKLGAKAYFEDVYKKIKGKLRVIKIGNESIELCGGTHVHNTNEIEAFKIINCIPKGSGSWRIEAITSFETINQHYQKILNEILLNTDKIEQECKQLNINNKSINKLIDSIRSIDHYNDDLAYQFNELNSLFTEYKLATIKKNNHNQQIIIKNNFIKNINDKKIFNICEFKNIENKLIFNALQELINECNNQIFVALNFVDNKLQYLIATNQIFANTNHYDLNKLIQAINKLNNGKGGGKPNFVQGGCLCENNTNIINQIKQLIENFKFN